VRFAYWTLVVRETTFVAGTLESGHALNYPEHRDRANGVRRDKLNPTRHAQRNAPNECYAAQHNSYKGNLSEFDPDVEEEQRGLDVILGQAHFTKRAGKSETME
jgi:hypothetical protein